MSCEEDIHREILLIVVIVIAISFLTNPSSQGGCEEDTIVSGG